jgi:hypothetical protein
VRRVVIVGGGVLGMMQTFPYGQRLTTAVADGDSLRYYPACELPARARCTAAGPASAGTSAAEALA